MKNIVLVYPRTGFDSVRRATDLPLSLLTIASTVYDDFEVTIIDQRVNDSWKEQLSAELEKDPLCVGISAMTGSQINYGLEVARITKDYRTRNKTRTSVVWGGIHGTLLPEQTIQNENIDFLVKGEGEITFKELVHALHSGEKFDAIAGLLYKENGAIKQNPEREKVSLETLPDLPYQLVNVEDYVHSKSMITENVQRVLPFITSRGCPYQCTYCCNPRLSRHKWRALSPEQTYERIRNVVDTYKLDGIVFHDENFLSDPGRAMKLAELIDSKFVWSIQGRMDAILEADMEKLYKLGLRMVQPGIESGSDRILELIKKGEDRQVMELANKKLAKTGIIPVYNFMIGFPGEEDRELMETVDFALKLIEDNSNVEIAGFYILVPYPGTEIFEIALREGFTPPASLEEWAKFDRQHNDTPWIRDKIKLLNHIMMSSKLIDGKRMGKLFGNKLLHFPLKLLGLFYRNQWKKHRFDSYLTKLMVDYFRAETKTMK